MRHDAMPIRYGSLSAGYHAKRVRTMASAKVLKKNAAVATFFFQKSLLWLNNKAHDRSTDKAHEERYKPVLSCFLPKGKVCNIKHDLGTSIAGVAS